ncbi:MAG: hypothetical protein KatS3mg108_1646 [Isosphaeraceae bacterium]|jgi:hypothetical protein|nr:MAG: hypothetical protein KatS3mg108_1646 [Isosphaeraceae bacterium]
MACARAAALAGLGAVILSVAATARGNPLESGRLKWATMPQTSSVAILRWGVGIWGEPAAGPQLSVLGPAPVSVAAAAPLAIQPVAADALKSNPLMVAPTNVFAPSVPVAAPPAPTDRDTATASRFATTWTNEPVRWSMRPAPPADSGAARPAYDAFVNLTGAGFVGAAGLTTGNALPWYLSPAVAKVYGGVPSAEQRLEFARDVLSRVEAAYVRSGLPIALTDQPGQAAHTLSVVSAAQSPANPDAVGVTEIGRDGFTFIDKLSYANTVDELKTAVAHNVAHELMHAFGVDRHDPTGGYLDSGVADWNTLIDPHATFSPEAVRLLASRDFRAIGPAPATAAQEVDHGSACPHCLQVLASPVPEPAAWMGWVAGGLVAGWLRSRTRRRLF